MATLNDRQKFEIVRQLASFSGYSEVARRVSADWGVAVDRFQVRAYDPDNLRYAAGERWREVFERLRSAEVEALKNVPITHPAFRLRMLQVGLEEAKETGNLRLANRILAQASAEMRAMEARRSSIRSRRSYRRRKRS